jgi:hypothetical protein
MWRRHDRIDATGYRRTGHGERDLEVSRAVIDARQQMAMEIDHGGGRP